VQRSAWWRNFSTPADVAVMIAGRIRHGTAHLVAAQEPAWEQARDLYAARWRRSPQAIAGPLVVISLEPARWPVASPTPSEGRGTFPSQQD